jgi:hypothetical protein
VSSFAIFNLETGKCLGEGKTEEDAVLNACETLDTAGVESKWWNVRLVEYVGGDKDSKVIPIHPKWNGSHLTGQS